MSKFNLGARSAFPVTDERLIDIDSGMSYRQWLAGQIASGLTGEEDVLRDLIKLSKDAPMNPDVLFSRTVVRLTDCLIAELEVGMG